MIGASGNARVVTIGTGTLQQAERDAYEAGHRAALAGGTKKLMKLTRHVETAIALLKSGDPVRAFEVLDKASKEARR